MSKPPRNVAERGARWFKAHNTDDEGCMCVHHITPVEDGWTRGKVAVVVLTAPFWLIVAIPIVIGGLVVSIPRYFVEGRWVFLE